MGRAARILLILLSIHLPAAAYAAKSGDAGALFLRFGMGGRASGMGEAFTAVAKDASAVYWNPGAMAAVLGTNLMFMHNEYLQSIRLEQAALTHETEWGTIGLGFTGLYMDEMERYENVPASAPLGTFSAYDVSAEIAFARYVLPNLAVGAGVKSIFEKIDEETAQGVAFDVGVYHVSRIEGVKFAAMIGNIGAPIRFVNEDFALPRVVKIGGSFERAYPALKGDVLVTLDILFPNDGDVREHVGFEYGYDGRLFLRSGFKAGYDSQGATFGAGVRYRQFFVDYAVLLISNDLGDSHRIGLSLNL